MSCFVFVLHQERGAALADDVLDWLADRGHETRLLPEDAALVGRPDLAVPAEELAVGADVVMSLGGDGTMLRSVELAADEDVPVLGVNLGQLGYLTEVEPGGMRMAVKRFLSGSYSIQERMRLDVEVRRAGSDPVRLRALNEAVVEKSEPGHTVRLEVELDGRPFTSYVADGLVLATPTGSTAYSFSVRGPIVDPEHRAVLLAPVAPHMLFDRTMVLRPDCGSPWPGVGPPASPSTVGELPRCSPGTRSSAPAASVRHGS